LNKFLIRLVASAVLTALLFSSLTLVGCKKKEKPKGLFDKANEVITKIDETTKDISQEIQDFASSLKAGTQLTITLVEEMYTSLKENTENIISNVKDARQEIERIASSEDDPDYKKYAEIQEEILDNAVAITKTISDLFDQLSAASQSLKSGKAVDSSSIAKTAEDLSKELDNLRAQGARLKEKATKFKEEKGL